MKKLIMAALLAAQVLSAAPAGAAGFAPDRETEASAFAGIRLRLPLDGETSHRRLRAGLALAPALHTRDRDGRVRSQIGEGLELGLVRGEPVRLALAGRPVSELVRGGEDPDGRRAGVSTLGWVAIGVGAVIVVGLGVGYLWLEEALDCNPGDDCS